MSAIASQADMNGNEIVKCCMQAKAIIGLCERAAWSDLQNGLNGDDFALIAQVSEDVQFALQLAADLIVPMQEALEIHEGLKSESTRKRPNEAPSRRLGAPDPESRQEAAPDSPLPHRCRTRYDRHGRAASRKDAA